MTNFTHFVTHSRTFLGMHQEAKICLFNVLLQVLHAAHFSFVYFDTVPFIAVHAQLVRNSRVPI